MAYDVEEKKEQNTFLYGFKVGDYDRSKTIILDPGMLIYCGYLGGNKQDNIYGLAIDQKGCLYVTGRTDSDDNSFPIEVGPDLVHNGEPDAFVAKVNKTGTELIYCGFIGGTDNEQGQGIAIDAEGNAYVIGTTESDQGDEHFPVSENSIFDNTLCGGGDAFVAKVDPNGVLLYCGYIGGQGQDFGRGIAVDDQNRVYFAGQVSYSVADFTDADEWFNETFMGEADAFVGRIYANGEKVEYCGFIGGTGYDTAYGIGVDDEYNAYTFGTTNSNEDPDPQLGGQFPVKYGPDLTYNDGFRDGFIAKIDAAGTDTVYCGYIGGSGEENPCTGIAVEKESGCVYVTGSTTSADFPVTVGPDLTHNEGVDGFVTKVKSDPGAPNPIDNFHYSGYIGGVGDDWGEGITIDRGGRAYITGYTDSDESSFPVVLGPDLYHNGKKDGFIAVIKPNPSETTVEDNYYCCGYVGGSEDDTAQKIVADNLGNAYIGGSVYSDETTFPVKNGPYTEFSGGVDSDGYVAKVAALYLSIDEGNISATNGGTVEFYLNAGAEKANRKYIMLGGVTGSVPGFSLPNGTSVLPINFDVFTEYIVIPLLNTYYFENFLGALDENGEGIAHLNVPPQLIISNQITMYYAYCLRSPWEFVSNPVEVKLVP